MERMRKQNPRAKTATALPALRKLAPLAPAPALQPGQPQARAVQRFTQRPLQAQQVAARPVLQALGLQAQEEQRLQRQHTELHQQLQRQAASPADLASAQHRQQVSSAVPLKPKTPADWVTVMRAQAEQAEGRWMQTREMEQFKALQRQVASSLVSSYRQNRSPASERHAEFAGYLTTLQRHPGSAQVARVVMSQLPSAERPILQRAVDEQLQRLKEQEEHDAGVLHSHALQRQLDELEQEATQPVLQRIQQRRGSGNPLPEAVRRHLEQGLNHDLSGVRIHDDAEADKLSKSVNAIAFTTGTDIFFQAGKYEPNTQTGLELLAHEVTHTVQQARGEVGPGLDPSASHETQARDMGRQMAARPVNNFKNKSHSTPAAIRSTTYKNTIQKSPDDRNLPQVGMTKVHPDVALKMLESYKTTGKFNFKPELGKGGASWFVTKGNPYVGIDASKDVPIEVEMSISKDAVVFREADLIKLLRETEIEQKAAIEAEWMKRKGHLPINARERSEFKRFSQNLMRIRCGIRLRLKLSPLGKVLAE